MDFDDKYKPEKALVKAEDVLVRWEEEQVARILVYNHLKEVVPALAEEFKDAYPCVSSMVPVQLSLILEESLLNYKNIKVTESDEKNCTERVRREGEGNGRLGEKQARFTDEQVNRLSRAIKDNENITAVAQ